MEPSNTDFLDIYKEADSYDDYMQKCIEAGLDEDTATMLYTELTLKYST